MAQVTDVRNNTSAARFERPTEQGLAVLEYVMSGDRMDLVHTEVPPALEGRGIGAALVRAALDHARDHRLRVTPTCPFVRAYLQRHPEYERLVTNH